MSSQSGPGPGAGPVGSDERVALALAELAERADGTEVDGTADLVRGRRALRRRRALTVAGAALAAVVVVGSTVATTLALQGDDGRGSPADLAGGSGGSGVATDGPGGPTSAADLGPQQLLERYRDVLAEHLDPRGEHLDRRVTNTQSGNGLGTKLGWRVEGSGGLAEVQVFAGGRLGGGGGTEWPCRWEVGWTCEQRVVDGTEVTVTTSPDGIGVGVERADGTAVSIVTRSLFANNSLTPVEGGVDVSVGQLVAAATDPALVKPTREQLDRVQARFERQLERWSNGG